MSHPNTTKAPVVWVVNKAGHPVTKAERFGRLVPLTTGAVNPFRPDRLMFLIGPRLAMADQEDYVMISGLPILNALVMTMWLTKFPFIKILQWSTQDRDYKEILIMRESVISNTLNATPPAE